MKQGGGNRVLKTGSKEYTARELEVIKMQESRKYSSVEFSNKGGGYVAVEKSAKKKTKDEIKAAKLLSNKGYKVILKDEAGELTTHDGYIFKFTYDQNTPEKKTKEGGKLTENQKVRRVAKFLEHAKKKDADISLIYMKHKAYNKQNIIDGIKRYEKHNKYYRLKKIIILTKNGRIHVHKHNDT